MLDQTLLESPSKKLPNGNNLERDIIPLTSNGNPAYWESGGGSTNTGHATIVTDRMYQKLKPLYIRHKGMLSNSNHALMPLRRGYKIIKVWHHRDDFEIAILEVKNITGSIATFELISTFSCETQRGWEDKLYANAIKAGINKSKDYHCKVPYYIETNSNA